MKKNFELKMAAILAFLYVALGTMELFLSINIAHSLDALHDGLDLYTIFPAHICGTILWGFLGNGTTDTIIFGWIGQFVGLVIYTILFFIIIKLITGINRLLKKQFENRYFF
jgi:hypothetical protein